MIKFFGFAKVLFVFVLLGLLMTTSADVAFAHKVNIFAYVEGDMVYTESYFPDGKKAIGGLIEVYDSQGNKLLDGKTNKDGQFNFKSPKKDDLKIVINASMGHRNSYVLLADELPNSTEKRITELPEASSKFVQVDIEQIKRVIDDSINLRLRPVMKKLAKLEQREVSFVEVIGGIGCIFGIAGVAFYFLSKKR